MLTQKMLGISINNDLLLIYRSKRAGKLPASVGATLVHGSGLHEY
jgi:hypothetical protein